MQSHFSSIYPSAIAPAEQLQNIYFDSFEGADFSEISRIKKKQFNIYTAILLKE